MKKILLFISAALFVSSVFAQEDSTAQSKKPKQAITLNNRANDHLMIQLGYTGWTGKPDSIHTGGLSKSFNVYFMLDFPFKTNPHLSIAFGPGIASDHIGFKKTYVGVKDLTGTLRFIDQSDTNHFKRTTLATAWLEAPIEFRYSSDPANPGKSFKAAIGIKVGTLINVHTRYKDLQSSAGTTLNDYTMKESSKHFFNSNRLSAMARVGLGHITLFGTYQITTLLKDGRGAQMRPYSIGLTLSGL
jgi:Outer membrane protein beta-barrel domain